MIASNTKQRIITSCFLIFLLILIIKFDFILTYSLIIFGVISILEFVEISNKIFKKNIFKYFLNFILIIYIFIFCVLFLYISSFLNQKIILYTLLFGCIASDIGGFLIGKLFKGPKLTKISPNKTYSGAIGSLVFTLFII